MDIKETGFTGKEREIIVSEKFPGLHCALIKFPVSLPTEETLISGRHADQLADLQEVTKAGDFDSAKKIRKEFKDETEKINVPMLVYFDLNKNLELSRTDKPDVALTFVINKTMNQLIGDDLRIYPQSVLMKDVVMSDKKVALFTLDGISRGERPNEWMVRDENGEKVSVQEWVNVMDDDPNIGLILVSTCNRKEDEPYMLKVKNKPVIYADTEVPIGFKPTTLRLAIPLTE